MSTSTGHISNSFNASIANSRMHLQDVMPNQTFDRTIDYQQLNSMGQIGRDIAKQVVHKAWMQDSEMMVPMLMALKTAKTLAAQPDFFKRGKAGKIGTIFDADPKKITSVFGDSQNINSQEYSFKILGNRDQVYKILEGPKPAELTTRNGVSYAGATVSGVPRRFTLVMNKRAYSVEEKFAIFGSNINFFVKQIEQVANGTKLLCEVADNQVNQGGIPVRDLAPGEEIQCLGNNKTEFSRHGSTFDMAFGMSARGYTNSFRYQMGITKYVEKAMQGTTSFCCDMDGTPTKITIKKAEFETMKRAMKDIDRQLMFGEPLRDTNGSFKRDPNGGLYYTEAGLLHQIDSRNKRRFNRITYKLLLDIIQICSNSQGSGGHPTVLIWAGPKAAMQISQILQDAFKAQPEPLYIDSASRALIARKAGDAGGTGAGSAQGINTWFNTIVTPIGTIIVKQCPYLSGYHQGVKQITSGPYMGDREAEHSFYVLNLGDRFVGGESENVGGFNDISLFSFLPAITGTIKGLGFNEVISTPQMTQEQHWYFNLSLRLHDTTGFMYFRPNYA